ncbi:MAG TPA: F0F1 ATP synthase subunit epsilon [Candidatus Limnocylindria bacterium]|nr:F0F1 ATP synthase subunit epsilon [Candidatus Limnocylindria bacterium]
MPLRLEIITPERKVLEEEVDMVVAPASEGYVGILPHHAPLLTSLGPGELIVKKGGVEETLAVFGGFMDVRGGRVTILTDEADRAEELDEERVHRAREEAQKVLEVPGLSPAEEARARAQLERSLVRLRVTQRRRKRV